MNRENRRRKEQSWKARGFTQLPNILMSSALPVGVRATANAIYARAFGSRQGVCLTVSTIAKDVGVSRQTVHKHMNILEMAGLIRRVRRGQRLANVIVLTLKEHGTNLSESIQHGLTRIMPALFGEKRTTAWWVERWRIHKEAMRGMPY